VVLLVLVVQAVQLFHSSVHFHKILEVVVANVLEAVVAIVLGVATQEVAVVVANV
jgi:hypothetical protein